MKKYLFRLLFATSVLALSQPLHAQVAPLKQWDKTIGGNNMDMLFSMNQTSDGGYILGGVSISDIGADKSQVCRGTDDYWVVKTDASGIKQWDKTFGGNHIDVLTSLQQTSDGGYILGGHSFSPAGGDKTQGGGGGWLIKLSSTGTKLWDVNIGFIASFARLQQTSDGGFILGGQTDLSSTGNNDYAIVKVNSSGAQQWTKTLVGINQEMLRDIKQTTDGGYIVGGSSSSGIGGDKTEASLGLDDYWVVRLNANGVKLWDKTFGGSQYDLLTCLQQTSDGGFIIGGYSQSGVTLTKSHPNKGGYDYWIIKLDAIGTKQWDKTIGGNDFDYLTALQQTVDGGYILGGNSNTYMNGDKTEGVRGSDDYWVVKVNSSGVKQWDKTIGGSYLDLLSSIHQTADGGYILGGSSNSPLMHDKSQASNGGTINDFWIVKLGPDVLGTKESLASELSIYPNPTNGIITLDLKPINATLISVFNTLGQLVLTKSLVKGDIKEHIQIDLSKEAKGMYTIQVLSDNQVYTKKVVLQ